MLTRQTTRWIWPILLGCIALFYANEIWKSSKGTHPPEHHARAEHAEYEAKHDNILTDAWNWTTQEPISFYTSLLAIFTGALVLVAGIQIRYLTRADITARRSAIAARRSAIAARRSADHIPRVERAYLHGGGEPIGVQMWPVNGTLQNLPTFRLDINNHGKTPGELLEYGIGWCRIGEVDKLPVMPHYKWYYYRDFVQSNAPREIKKLKIPNDIPIGDAVIYGRFGYKDIFGERHSNGFVQHGAKPIMAPHLAYTESDPPWDVPYVGDREHRKYEKSD